MMVSGSCEVFGSDIQVQLGVRKSGKRHFVYPDVTISCERADGEPDNTLVESPLVVIEVLSPGTESKDRGVKFRAYQQCASIHEIVLASQFAQYVEVWQRDEQEPGDRHYGTNEHVEL